MENEKAGDVTACAEAVSKPGYKTGDWMPAIVPGTVLNSLVYNKVYPEPYYGLNNKLTSNIIPDLSVVGRDFILIGFVPISSFLLIIRGKSFGYSWTGSIIGRKSG